MLLELVECDEASQDEEVYWVLLESGRAYRLGALLLCSEHILASCRRLSLSSKSSLPRTPG